MNWIQLLLVFMVSVGASIASGPWVIPFLRRLKVGQSIREEGPQSHQVKAGTPTMGGMIIFIGFLAAFLLAIIFGNMIDTKALVVLIGFFGYGLIGFADDYIKVVMKRNLGLRAWQKIASQLVVSLVVTFMLMSEGTGVLIPGTTIHLQLGWAFIPFSLIVLVATTNGVNLTDGLDGLAGGVTVIVMGFFAFAAWQFGTPLLTAIALGVLGGCIGFLKYNLYPAKVFMGDIGSLALGGLVGTLAMALELPLLIPLVGLVYFAETLSVMIQITSFKLTGKRVFKMAPLHHHFELSGWKETKVVGVFWAVTAIMAVISFFLI